MERNNKGTHTYAVIVSLGVISAHYSSYKDWKKFIRI